MKEVNIKGKIFTEDEVCEYGKKAIAKKRKKLMIFGIILLTISILIMFANLFSAEASSDHAPSIGYYPSNTESENYIDTISLCMLFGIPGTVLFVLSFVISKKNPYTAGVKFLNKHFPDPIGFDGNTTNVLRCDKVIKLSKKPRFELLVSSNEKKIQIFSGKRYSKILSGNDVIEYEIKVDNEILITSNTKSKKGVGKAIIGGALFGGAGMIAGAVAGNKRSTSQQSQKEIHHYTLSLKINDILNPSFVIELESLQMAEEVTATLAIICQTNTPIENEENNMEEHKFDKFEELKKYKELLDAGIITQEEFETEKKKIIK